MIHAMLALGLPPGGTSRPGERRRPLVIAHRGAWRTARPVPATPGDGSPNSVGENTLEAFERAISIGADMIELDVRCTRDGHLIVFHDARVKTIPTASLRYDVIRVKGTHARPPLLAEVLALTKDRIALNLEVKEAGYVEDTLELLRPFGLERCLLSSFLDQVVLEAKSLAPDLRTGLLVGAGVRRALTTRLRASKADLLVLHRRLATAASLASAAAAGVPCVIWTVNAPRAMDRFLAHAAVEGVITDRPALALERRALLHGA
jgi:glycerophosphoryl diester phosphodiesterase